MPLIGRLTVEQRQQGQGRGSFLLMDTLHRSWQRAPAVAATAVVVDAKDDSAAGLDQHFDFTPLQSDPHRLYLSMRKIVALFR